MSTDILIFIVTQMPQVLQSCRDLCKSVVGDIQRCEGRHGRYLRWESLQTVAGEVQRGHLRQEANAAREGLNVNLNEICVLSAAIYGYSSNLQFVVSKVQIDEHVEITDSIIELLHLVVGGEQGVELEHAEDARGQRRQPVVAQVQLRHPGEGGDGVRQSLQLVIMKIQYLQTQQIGDLERKLLLYFNGVW